MGVLLEINSYIAHSIVPLVFRYVHLLLPALWRLPRKLPKTLSLRKASALPLGMRHLKDRLYWTYNVKTHSLRGRLLSISEIRSLKPALCETQTDVSAMWSSASLPFCWLC